MSVSERQLIISALFNIYRIINSAKACVPVGAAEGIKRGFTYTVRSYLRVASVIGILHDGVCLIDIILCLKLKIRRRISSALGVVLSNVFIIGYKGTVIVNSDLRHCKGAGNRFQSDGMRTLFKIIFKRLVIVAVRLVEIKRQPFRRQNLRRKQFISDRVIACLIALVSPVTLER